MDDPRLLRIILFGLVLAALTVGYLIFTGRFVRSQQIKTQTQVAISTPTPTITTLVNRLAVNSTPSPVPSASGRQIASSAYTRIVDRTQNKVTTLPKTGLPAVLLSVVSLSAIISGWFLRKFPE